MNQKLVIRLQTLALRALHENEPELSYSLMVIATCIQKGKVTELARTLELFAGVTARLELGGSDLSYFSRS